MVTTWRSPAAMTEGISLAGLKGTTRTHEFRTTSAYDRRRRRADPLAPPGVGRPGRASPRLRPRRYCRHARRRTRLRLAVPQRGWGPVLLREARRRRG